MREVNSLVFSKDGRLLLTGSSLGPDGDQSLIRLWEVRGGKELSRFGSHRASVESVAFSPDGTLVASGNAQPFKGERVPSFGSSGGGLVIHTPDSASRSPTIRLFEFASGREAQQFEYFKWVTSLIFSPDGKYLLTVGEEYLLWDVASGREAFQFRSEGSNWASSVDISSDGKYAAIGTGGQLEPGRYTDCGVRLWRLELPKELATFSHRRAVKRVAFISGHGAIVATGDGGEIHVWHLEDNET